MAHSLVESSLLVNEPLFRRLLALAGPADSGYFRRSGVSPKEISE